MTYREDERIYVCYSDREINCSFTGKTIPSSQPFLVIEAESSTHKIQIALEETHTLVEGVKELEDDRDGAAGLPINRIGKGKDNYHKCIICDSVPTKRPIISLGGFVDPWFHLSCADEFTEYLEKLAEVNSDKIVATNI